MTQLPKQFWLRRLFNNPQTLLVLLICLLFLISFPLAKNISRRHMVSSEIRALEQEIAENEVKKSKLIDSIKYFESNEFAEEQARINLDLKMPGENVVVVRNNGDSINKPDNKLNQLLSKPSLKEVEKKSSNPELWVRYFFN